MIVRAGASAVAGSVAVSTVTPPSRSGLNAGVNVAFIGTGDVEHLAAVVDALERVDDRPALDRGLADVVFHAGVGDDATDGHREDAR